MLLSYLSALALAQLRGRGAIVQIALVLVINQGQPPKTLYYYSPRRRINRPPSGPCSLCRVHRAGVSSPFLSRSAPDNPPVVTMEERLAINEPILLPQLRWELTQDFRAVEGLSTVCKVEGCGRALGVNPHSTCYRHMECLKTPAKDWCFSKCKYCCYLLSINTNVYRAEITDRRWRF